MNTSFLGIPLIRIFVILALSWVLHHVIRGRLRDTLVPWAFAGLLAHANMANFITGLPHFALLCLYFFNMALLLDGCNLRALLANNKVAKLFLLFWGYLTLTSIWSEYTYQALTWSLNTLLELVLVGYYAGFWALNREDGIRRLIRPAIVVCSLSYIFYFKYGFATTMDQNARGQLDMALMEEGAGNNVNGIGLALAPIVSCLLVFVQMSSQVKKTSKVTLCSSIIALLLSAYLLIRTGSRNACAIFLPCGYFLFNGFIQKGDRLKRVLFPIVLIGLLVIVVSLFMGGDSELRGFKLKESGDKFDINRVTSGRWSMYEEFISTMTPVDVLIGAGVPMHKDPIAGYVVKGILSTYVSIFYTTGFFGVILLSLYCGSLWNQCRKRGIIGKVAILFFLTWAVTGLGEDQGIRRGHAVRMLQGVSLALCSNLCYHRREQFWYHGACFKDRYW